MPTTLSPEARVLVYEALHELEAAGLIRAGWRPSPVATEAVNGQANGVAQGAVDPALAVRAQEIVVRLARNRQQTRAHRRESDRS